MIEFVEVQTQANCGKPYGNFCAGIEIFELRIKLCYQSHFFNPAGQASPHLRAPESSSMEPVGICPTSGLMSISIY